MSMTENQLTQHYSAVRQKFFPTRQRATKFFRSKPPTAAAREIKSVIATVADSYEVPVFDIMSDRGPDIDRVRNIAMYLARIVTKKSFPFIAKQFGRTHDTTPLKAFQRVECLLQTDAALAAEVVLLRNEIEAAR